MPAGWAWPFLVSMTGRTGRADLNGQHAIDLNPDLAREKKAAHDRRLQVRDRPSLRVLGYGLLLLLMAAHSILSLRSFSVPVFLAVSGGVLTYSLLSWLALHHFYPHRSAERRVPDGQPL